jgi:hypothetical protein
MRDNLSRSTLFRTIASRDHSVTICYVLMGLALAAGTYFRLKGLAKSPFAIDEYYIASSVRNILEHGLPQFNCGGYYPRGLLLQYLAAPLFKYGSNDELYFRLITVVFNLLTIPALYLLGKRIAGRAVACFVVVLFSVSIWEIEMARFARMYAPFQMLFAWYLYFLYKALIFTDATARKWMYWISLISIFVSEEAIFLVMLNFIPFIVNVKGIRLPEYITTILILIIAYVFITTDWRFLGAQDYIPTDLPPSADSPILTRRPGIGPIELPVLLITTLISNPPWMLGFILPAASSFAAIWHLYFRAKSEETSEITVLQASIISLFIILSLINQFGLLIELVIIVIVMNYLFLSFSLSAIKARSLIWPAVAISATFCFWLSYTIFSEKWRVLLDTWVLFDAEDNVHLRQVLTVLFGYPDVLLKILRPWAGAMPMTSVVIGILALYGFSVALVKRSMDSEGYLFLIGILVVLSMMLAVLGQQYFAIRYSFFMYPVVLLVIIISLNRLAQSFYKSVKYHNVYLAALVAFFMLVWEDFQIDHLWNIDSDRILYRLQYNSWGKGQYYNRYDFRSPALLVNEGLKAGDIVVSITYGVPYYLRQLDYFYRNHQSEWIKAIMACNGTKDLWTNANLIYKPEKLLTLLNNAKSTTWVIMQTSSKINKSELDEIRKIFASYRVFQTVDGTIEVYRIPPQGERVG